MGFCRAELEIKEETRTFFLPGTRHDQEDVLFREICKLPEGGVITLYVDMDVFSQRQFAVVSDIAIEALNKAMARWYVVNKTPFTFGAEAAPAAVIDLKKHVASTDLPTERSSRAFPFYMDTY